ncbi:PREDICTED: ectonucleoside triphosphate diphosphohydrolase 8-like [Lepidothrix coronata]|uniref:Ectonucleoside triphosphate diphosphohydrolase 8 n=1 Tax=Lepidothrix coronata TaxID=321398 RepID=A0A6J0ITZ0_9PASS|nr:PREDICTED: ectonucleoside triphosphate diphosphohydrolase 8-like [Lepidothrix coronata]
MVGGGMDTKAKAVAGLLAATCVCSIITLILSVVNVKDVFLPPSTKYGLVFDAGSTHTSLYTYRWPADKENGTGIVSQVDVCTVEGECAGMCLSLSLPSSPGGRCGCPAPVLARVAVPHAKAGSHQVWYQENVTVAELYDSPCVRAPSTASPAQVLTVTGTGDPARCSTAVQKLFNFSCGAQRPCGFNGVYQPPVRGQFFAFAGFYYTFHFLNLTSQQSLNDVNTTILAFCKRNWSELERTFPQDKKYLHTYCSAAIYILTLLLDGFKFNEHTWSNIHFSQQAAHTDIGWTLGFMLNFTNMIPAEPLELVKGHQPGLWAGAVSFIVLALVTGLVAAFLLCFWKTK